MIEMGICYLCLKYSRAKSKQSLTNVEELNSDELQY